MNRYSNLLLISYFLCSYNQILHAEMKAIDTAAELEKQIENSQNLVIAVHDEELSACEKMEIMISEMADNLKEKNVSVNTIAHTELPHFKEYLISKKYHDGKYIITPPVYYYFKNQKLVQEVVGLSLINTRDRFMRMIDKSFFANDNLTAANTAEESSPQATAPIKTKSPAKENLLPQ